jgi:hypothetical protein
LQLHYLLQALEPVVALIFCSEKAMHKTGTSA